MQCLRKPQQRGQRCVGFSSLNAQQVRSVNVGDICQFAELQISRMPAQSDCVGESPGDQAVVALLIELLSGYAAGTELASRLLETAIAADRGRNVVTKNHPCLSLRLIALWQPAMVRQLWIHACNQARCKQGCRGIIM